MPAVCAKPRHTSTWLSLVLPAVHPHYLLAFLAPATLALFFLISFLLSFYFPSSFFFRFFWILLFFILKSYNLAHSFMEAPATLYCTSMFLPDLQHDAPPTLPCFLSHSFFSSFLHSLPYSSLVELSPYQAHKNLPALLSFPPFMKQKH